MTTVIQDAIEARGAFAFMNGKSRSENPFKANTDEHFMWDVGWLENENSEAMRRRCKRTSFK